MKWRLVVGFLAAPIVPALFAAVLLEGLQGGSLDMNWRAVWGGFLMTLFVAELLTILIAVPLFFGIRRFRRVGLAECLVSGVLIGLVAGILGMIVGTFSGLLFWAIAIRSGRGPNNALNTDAAHSQRAG